VEIRDELMTTFLAGSVTTAAGISWGIEILARHHAVREQLRSEIAAGADESYLTAFVNELHRCKPPLVTAIPRVAMKPFELDGRVYAPGTRIVVATYLLHHNPAVYADPYTFRPERFLERSPDPYTFTAFGGGRRRCLGKAVGENEIKTVLREVLTNYDLRPEHAPLPTSDSHTVILKPARGARLALTPRSRRG
jgi:cytochrome P450